MQKQRKLELKGISVLTIGLILIAFINNLHLLYFLAGFILVVSFLSPIVGSLIYKFWMKVTFVLGLIMPKILLAIIFYLFLFPLSLLSKIFKKSDALLLNNNKESTFIEINKTFIKQDFEKPW